MSKTDYLTLLTEAHDFTVRHLHGGNTSYVTGLHLEKYDDASIREAYSFVQEIFSELSPSDVVNKCLPICLAHYRRIYDRSDYHDDHPPKKTGVVF